jgi:uncharacterized protein (TIGR02145 family)
MGSEFTWTATGSSPNLFGFSPGSGNRIQQTLINAGYSHETVTYTVTPSVNGCTGIPGIVIIGVDPLPAVSLTSCWDPVTTTSAQPFRLKGGIPLGGTWSGAGINTGIFTPSLAGPGTHILHYTYTNTFGCSGIAGQPITVVPTPGFVCGDTLTDIRDNSNYPTVKFGNQCWMAADLNYGAEISPNIDQRDNCIPEKYHNPASDILHPASVYQWDELMNYDIMVSNQGLCPPGWHVPTEADWNTLFSNYINNGFAASPLKYSGFSGFTALLYGIRHLNKTWDYQGFAIFFWSSTSNGPLKAWSHGMNDLDPSVSAYPSFRNNAFSVRCLKD